jgi:hypothetical protein
LFFASSGSFCAKPVLRCVPKHEHVGKARSDRLISNPFKQLRNRQVKCVSDRLHRSKAEFLFSNLNVGNVALVDASFLCKVDLTPTLCRPQFADAQTEQDANVTWHPYYGRTRIEAAFLLSSELGTSEIALFPEIAGSREDAYRFLLCGHVTEAWCAR